MMRRGSAVKLLLLAGGALATLWVLAASLRERLDEEHLTAATAALQSVATSVARAHELGVPLADIAGLDGLVHARVTADSGITGLRLLDPRGRVLWQQPGRRTGAALLEAPIGTDGRLQAQFIPPDEAGPAGRLAALLLAVTAALALPLYELVRLSAVLREGFSGRYFQRQLQAVRRGDLRVAWQTAGVAADARLHFLRDRLFALNEQYHRVVRLVGSLRRTEPDIGRRTRMNELLEGLGGRFRFATDAAPVVRRVWPTADTVRCFAAFTLLLANLSLGAGGSSPYEVATQSYSALSALAAWSGGLLAGTAMGRYWPARLRAGIAAAALANLLMMVGETWSNMGAHAVGGIATGLAACAAMQAGQARARRSLVTVVLAGTVAGPVLGLAAIAALGSVASEAWLYGGAVLVAAIAAAGLPYLLLERPVSSADRPCGRLATAAVLAGAAWSAAFLVFIAYSSANREQALRLMAVEIPGMVMLARAGARARTALAVALMLIGVLRLGAWALPQMQAVWPSPDLLAWAGAACMAGALATPYNCRGFPLQAIAGCAAGVFLTLVAIALVAWAAPRSAAPVALCVMLAALAAAFALSRAQGRVR